MCGNFSKDEIDSLYKVIFSRRDVRSGFTGETRMKFHGCENPTDGP